MDGGGVGTAFFANGVPQSKQNFAAGGLSARQFGQGFCGGSGTESTGSTGVVERAEGGGAGGGRRAGVAPVGPAAAATAPSGAATRARPVEPGGGARPA